MYRIESRYPQWARWRVVPASPHREKCPFDAKGLIFSSIEDAYSHMAKMQLANAGEFRIVIDNSPDTTINQGH
jgi:hypothetical protein